MKKNSSQKIKTLNLSNKNLKVIPKYVYSLKNLEELDLSNNYISKK